MATWLSTEEPISWLVYPLEYMISEKLETLCRRGSANSRAKDIFDLIELFPRCKNKDALLQAIKATFNNRKTEIPTSFFTFVSEINPIVLRSAWGSILSPMKLPFDTCWPLLLKFLDELDLSKEEGRP